MRRYRMDYSPQTPEQISRRATLSKTLLSVGGCIATALGGWVVFLSIFEPEKAAEFMDVQRGQVAAALVVAAGLCCLIWARFYDAMAYFPEYGRYEETEKMCKSFVVAGVAGALPVSLLLFTTDILPTAAEFGTVAFFGFIAGVGTQMMMDNFQRHQAYLAFIEKKKFEEQRRTGEDVQS